MALSLSVRSVLIPATMFALLAGCDRQAAQPTQQHGDLAGAKQALAGEIDRGFAGDLMPAVNVTDPAGNMLNTGALQGTPVLLNLWATWCAPCVVEMPMLDDLAQQYDGKLRVLTVSQDFQGAKKVEPFFQTRSFAKLEPWMDPETELGFAFEGGVLPLSVLYDANGQEVARVVGGYDWTSAEALELVEEVVGSQ